MENIFIIIVGLLFILAISDLIVGVSNDAVNFLNSAIGSKAAPLRVILIVAALGVLVGATFSNGMMEVARKGIFVPEAFTFKEIMIIFLTVMLTDVILLDLFNTFGLPTSTTVSIVFELLGAAVGVALIKVMGDNPIHDDIASYINSGKALTIIFGILLSVVVAFTVGVIVQWLARLMFSFNYEKNIKYFGAIFGGIAVTGITYFILIKGLRGSVYADSVVNSVSLKDWTDFFAHQSFDDFKSLAKSLAKLEVSPDLTAWGKTLSSYSKENYKTGIDAFVSWSHQQSDTINVPLQLLHWVKYYSINILLISFVSFSALFQILHAVFRLNILRAIVIIGTFALAMAFAGNDLVNFIGVPLAGFSSFKEFLRPEHGGSTDFYMEVLSGKVDTNPLFLLIAGLIMVITLWLSKKAKSVVKTTLNLSDQDQVNERFESSGLARALVRSAVNVGDGIGKIIPASFKSKLSGRFDSQQFNPHAKEQGVSFDLIRASVNLVVASILIAIGTSFKLPLSTTYVTFMVAMGTSLADGAWDRESAVYRISGVVTVIGGWFFTALSAFIVALLIALLIYSTWWGGVFVMAAIALFVVYKTHILHKKRSEKEQKTELSESIIPNDSETMFEACSSSIVSSMLAAGKIYNQVIQGLEQEKRKTLKQALKQAENINSEAKLLKKKVPTVFAKLSDEAFESGQNYVEIIDYLREGMHCLYYFTLPAFQHVENKHKPITAYQASSLEELATETGTYFDAIIKSISESDFNNTSKLIGKSQELADLILKHRKKQLKIIKTETGSTRTNLLYLDMLNETKNLLLNINNMYKAFRDFYEQNRQAGLKKVI